MNASVSKLLLRNVPLFSALPDDQIELLASMVQRKSVARGETVIQAGAVTDSLYVVISGRLKVIMSDDNDHEVILAMLGPNEYFGEMLPIDDHPRSASVIALDPCEVMVLTKGQFRECLAKNIDVTMAVMRCLVQRLREADRKIGSLALMDVNGRLVQLLLEISETIDGERVVTQKIAQQDMARMIGASREMVGRVMKDLQQRGFVELRGKTIHLRDNLASFR